MFQTLFVGSVFRCSTSSPRQQHGRSRPSPTVLDALMTTSYMHFAPNSPRVQPQRMASMRVVAAARPAPLLHRALRQQVTRQHRLTAGLGGRQREEVSDRVSKTRISWGRSLGMVHSRLYERACTRYVRLLFAFVCCRLGRCLRYYLCFIEIFIRG